MRCRYLILVSLLVLASCAPKECSSSNDCAERSAFSASCAKGECVYSPVPNVCGNERCESGETKANCANDCGGCNGKVSGSQLLEYQQVNGRCVEGVPSVLVKPVVVANDVAGGGNRFHFDTVYSQPFNLRKDQFEFAIQLDQGLQNRDLFITDVELSGTKDRRSVVFARKSISRPLIEGVHLREVLVLDFPMQELEGELSNLVLKFKYEYVSVQGDRLVRKEGSAQIAYKDKFVVVNPPSQYPCPDCNDNNPATLDSCNQQNFCEHEPVPGVCGNGLCDGAENKCDCAKDCGACSGTGSVTVYSCKANQCVASLRDSVVLTPHNIFESRDIGPVELANNYRFTTPFNVMTDVLSVDINRYGADASVSKITIETLRLLEGSQVIAELSINQELGLAPMNLSLKIPPLPVVEKEAALAVAVWYSYVQNDKTQRGMFQKPLGRLLIVSP